MGLAELGIRGGAWVELVWWWWCGCGLVGVGGGVNVQEVVQIICRCRVLARGVGWGAGPD